MLPTKKESLLYASLVVSVLVVLLFIFQFLFHKPDVVYVDNIQLFDGFNMTKEMKKIGENQFNTQKTKIDSLYVTIQKSNPAQQQILMKEYVALKENLEQFNQQFAYEETEKIWKRLHSYVDEFSGENNYKLIIGAEKKQDILYADPSVNITNELINYVNSKYEGAK
ncbi:OmpH family outer membrane protein [Flavobacterium amnicola]|uniref:OmpH family outer membrane protein n=1 Tax=Flavobacterium amnicola TaxID=2506422 RepID=A0A4Q1K700_9FLAO|nr:OmpH family outer membrane protein [Flavobacterium amnicola]RXR21245.1 OmpH family outer membrane protein [Flavobacterium amnicola]